MHRFTRHAVVAGCLAALGLAACGSSSPTPTPSAADLVKSAISDESHNQLDQARAALTQALQADPKNEAAYFNLGLVAQLQKDTTAASSYYRTALVLNPTDKDALYNLGTVVAATSPYEAIELYYHVIALDPKYAAAYLNLGFALKSVGQVDVGNANIAKAIQLDPSLGHSTTTTSPSPGSTPSS